MRISPLKNISFQKKLVATCALNGVKDADTAFIYNLEDKDKKYFENLMSSKGWKNGYRYLESLDYDMYNGNAEDIYVIEDSKNNCLGCMEAYEADNETMALEFIETKPYYRSSKNKQSRYIGETLINFLIQSAKKEGKKIVHVIRPEDKARGFYEKCGFIYDELIGMKYMCEKSEDLAKRNLEHTGGTIEFIG